MYPIKGLTRNKLIIINLRTARLLGQSSTSAFSFNIQLFKIPIVNLPNILKLLINYARDSITL